jgi:hypothetical protein
MTRQDPLQRTDPLCTYWFSLPELERVERAGGAEAAVLAVWAEVQAACQDISRESGGRMALALVFSPRLYSFLACRATLGGSVPAMLDGETVEIPVYLQSPCYTGDMRFSAVCYSTLESLREGDTVIHGLVASAAMKNLGLSAEAFEEGREE